MPDQIPIKRRLAMAFKENITELKKLALTLFIGVVVVLFTSAFVGGQSAKNVNELIDIRVDQRVDQRINTLIVPKLEAISTKLDYLVSVSYDDVIRSINKQVEKIKTDPADIKIADIEQIMRDWLYLPSERKTDDLVMKYEKIKEWYNHR